MRSGSSFGLALLLISIGCGACDTAPPVAKDAPFALETEDPRFQIWLERSTDGIAEGTQALHLGLVPKDGWHMTPEAPTTLDLSASPGLQLEAPSQRGEDAVDSSEERIAFAIAYRMSDGRSSPATDATLEGQLKFGVCRDGKPRCEIVQRKLEIPLAW